MPLTSRIAPKGQQAESFNSSYRSEISFKNFSAFLGRQLTIQGRQPNQIARFSLLEVLKHMNVEKAVLKGSAVNEWRNNKALADIDLQLPVNKAIDKNEFSRPLLEFLCQRSNLSAKCKKAMQEKTWFARVRHDLKDSWTRLIISIGYPAQHATTLDINVTNYQGIAYDTLQASRAIQFDLAQRKTFNIGTWHPSLVDWLANNQLLWFNPDIDEGLGRLSYRLSKSTEARLLQPEITTHFAEHATPDNIRNIYLRVLMNEYQGSTLSLKEQQQLWEPIIHAAAQPEHDSLKSNLLDWCKYQTLEEVHAALNTPSTQPVVLKQLSKACQIGVDFKNAVKNLLTVQAETTEVLKPLLGKALGAKVMSGESLFRMLDNWNQIQDIPKQELLTVFTELLNQVCQSAEPGASNRAKHMLGWLNGDEIATLQFWADRIPTGTNNQASAPAEKLMKPVMQSMLKIIKIKGAEGLIPALPQLSKLRISQSDWHVLLEALSNSQPNTTGQAGISSNDSVEPIIGFMQILAQHSATLGEIVGMGYTRTPAQGKAISSEQLHRDFYQDLMQYASKLQAQNIPPMLRNVLSIKSAGIEIALQGIVLSVSLSEAVITANAGATKHWFTEYGRAKLKTEPAGTSGVFYMEWHDGSLFSGDSITAGKFMFNGVLTRFDRQGEPNEIQGLLNTGRMLCKSRFPAIRIDLQSWSAKGLFSGKQLLKSKTLAEALLTLKQGAIIDQLLNTEARIEHEIINHTPVKCTVTVAGLDYCTEISTRYRKTGHLQIEGIQSNNVWGVEPAMEQVELIEQLVSAPFGIMNFASTMPWNKEQQTLQGRSEIKASGIIKFKWSGEFQSGELLPNGSLYLDKRKHPAIVFNNPTSSSNIPLPLLPVMADLLGRLNGSYNFSTNVWHESGSWPTPGYEGFVNNFTYQGLSFSGYVNAMGRAIGILRESPQENKDYYSSWTGSFYVRPTSLLNYQAVRLDGQELNPVCIPLSKNQVLTLHGFVREFMVQKNSHEPKARIDRMYFCGQSMMLTKTTRSPEISYDSPNTTLYMAGFGYTMNEQAKHLDLVYNPSDKGSDFFIIRPENYDELGTYQEIVRDSLGTIATWLVVNKEYRMVNAKFASGVEYSGKIERQGNFLRPTGNGKLSLHGLSFTADFEKHNTIKNIKAANSASSNWLVNKTNAGSGAVATLSDWIKLLSDGQLDWHKDVQAQLKVRDVESLKDQAIVFSRS